MAMVTVEISISPERRGAVAAWLRMAVQKYEADEGGNWTPIMNEETAELQKLADLIDS